MSDEISPGDHITVDIDSPANPFGSTQQAHFIAEEVSEDTITGTDPDWGDTCEVSGLNSDSAHYKDGGKSGDVVTVKVHEAHEDGGYWGDRYEVVWGEE